MPAAKSRSTSVGSVWDDLVVSVLAVIRYSLESTYKYLDGLREQGLTDPANLARWDTQEIKKRLKACGLDRGPFLTKLFAERLSALGLFAARVGVSKCSEIISGSDPEAIDRLLMPVKGIGPVVLDNFYILRNLRS